MKGARESLCLIVAALACSYAGFAPRADARSDGVVTMDEMKVWRAIAMMAPPG